MYMKNNKKSNRKKMNKLLICFVIVLILTVFVATFLYVKFYDSKILSIVIPNITSITKQVTKQVETQEKLDDLDTNYIIKEYDIDEPLQNLINQFPNNTNNIYNEAIRLSEPTKGINYKIDNTAGDENTPIFTGKRINIAITGLDARMGQVSKLADANHVISILIETGEIEITSIPRDTYCDLGFELDSTGLDLNKLTICRAKKGRNKYHEELAKIARLDKIHYWVEFGFSQAMAIIEFLGFKDPASTLQVLRSRKGLGGDDFQRCYSQGQFIRQAILSHFNKFTGTLGGVLARAGLLLVETNLTGDKVVEIINNLENVDFPKSAASVVVLVRPPLKIDYKAYDFNDETVANIVKKIEKFNKPRFDNGIEEPQPIVDISEKLNKVIQSVIIDTANNPNRVISTLSLYFEQRVWFQVKNKDEREKIRKQIAELLIAAYNKKNKKEEADKIKEIIEAENKIFNP